jgi:hypothetical protein
MNCHECEVLLQLRLDGTPTSSAALESHLKECATCRENHAAAMRLLEGLKQQPKPKIDPGFARRMTEEVLLDRKTRADKMRRRVWLTAALAAAVLFLVALAFYLFPRTPSNDPPAKDQIVKDGPKKVEPKIEHPKKKFEPENRHAKKEVRPFVDLPERMAEATRDHAKVVMVAANLDGMDKLPPMDLPNDPGVREAGQEVSDGVRAVTRSARRAFDFFVRELPMPENLAKGD